MSGGAFGRRLAAAGGALRTAWLVVGMTLAFAVVFDLALRLFISDAAFDDPRVAADGYPSNADWVRPYFEELDEALEMRWQPYVYYRRAPYHGKYMNIDERGLRLTWNKKLESGQKPVRVFMFGGSTMEGIGARDDFTIPSMASKQLAEHGFAAEVTNFGGPGYVSTQETIALLRELQAGNVPDVVVFYDGVNDTFGPYQSGQAGTPHNEQNRRVEFNLTHPRQTARLIRAAIRGAFMKTAIMQLVYKSAAKHAGKPHSPVDELPADRFAELVNETTRIYRANLRTVHALGKEYGFTVLCYWQPLAYTKQTLTAFEQKDAEKWSNAKPFILAVYEKIRAIPPDEVKDLSQLFATDPRPYYVDFHHVTEDGNEKIVQAMLPDLLAAAKAHAPEGGSVPPTPVP